MSLAKSGLFPAIYKGVGVWLQGCAACIQDKDIPTLNWDKAVCVLVFTDPAPVQTLFSWYQSPFSARFIPVQPIYSRFKHL